VADLPYEDYATDLSLLRAWAGRGIAQDRVFEVRYLAGIEHPWCVRLEDTTRSWSNNVDCCTFLRDAVAHSLRCAEAAGFP